MKSLFNDDFFESMGSSVLPVDEAQMLPPQCYSAPEFFEFEKSAVFDKEWLCVGRENWALKPGDYFTAIVVGEPIVVVRGNDGVLRAMSNVCQHRAMLLAEGHGNTRALLCQYHHWSYSLDGQLIGAPAMERAVGFDKKCVRLPEFKVEVWLGFVFINFDLDAKPLTPRLSVLTQALANYDLPTAEGPHPGDAVKFPWNWKVMMENNNDGYHANKLHVGPLHNVVPSHLSVFPDLPKDTAGYFRFNGTLHQDAAFNVTHKALLPVFPKLTTEERNRFLFANVPPTLSLVVMSDMVTYMILHAISPTEVGMIRGHLVAPGASRTPLFEERLEVGATAIKSIVAQDLHVDAMITHGLNSRFAARGRYSWQERSQRDFNDWLVTRYRAAWAARRPAEATA